MAHIPSAVTAGYLREPDTELPLAEQEFARRINSILAAADRPCIWDSHPSRSTPGSYTSPGTRGAERGHRQTIPEQMGPATVASRTRFRGMSKGW